MSTAGVSWSYTHLHRILFRVFPEREHHLGTVGERQRCHAHRVRSQLQLADDVSDVGQHGLEALVTYASRRVDRERHIRHAVAIFSTTYPLNGVFQV